MKRTSLAEARRLAAQADAYHWYCEVRGMAEPQAHMDDGTLEQHANAWAWARTNWRGFLTNTSSPERQFLIDLFNRGAAYCRKKSVAAYGTTRTTPEGTPTGIEVGQPFARVSRR